MVAPVFRSLQELAAPLAVPDGRDLADEAADSGDALDHAW
jgi:hypothetical protein